MTVSPRRYEQRLAIILAGGGLVILSLVPLLWPVVEIMVRDPGGLWSGLLTLKNPRPWLLLARSLGLAGTVTLGALGIGVPLGLLLGRFDLKGRQYLLLLQAVPMFLPPFLLALGWFYLWGRQGLLGGEWSAGLLFSGAGCVAILTLAFAPLAASLVTLGLWNLNPALEEAARTVARPGRVALFILLPAVWPAVTLAGILIFSLTLSEMGVPMFLRFDVYPAAVFARLGGIDYNPGEAFILALPLIPFAIILLALERWLFRDRSFAVLGIRNQDRPPMPLGRCRWPVSLAAWSLVLLSLTALASLVIRGLQDRGFRDLPNWIGSSLTNSLISSLGAATLVLGIALILGHASARHLKGAKLFEVIALQAFFTPAVLLGVGLITLWNHPATGFIYQSLGIIMLGYMARYAVVGMRSLAVAVSQSPASLEMAAASMGGSYIQRFLHIVIPLNWQGIGAAWLLTAVFCLRDLETAVLFYPPGSEPLTVRIFTLEANGPEAVVAALAVVQVLITLSLLTVGTWLLRRTPSSWLSE